MNTVYQDRLNNLTDLLVTYQWLWDVRPFEVNTVPWQDERPELFRAISHLSDQQVADLRHKPRDIVELIADYLPDLEQLQALVQLPRLPQEPLTYPPFLDTGVPGRKWSQITEFTKTLANKQDAMHYVDWCAGKGYLSRALANNGHSVSAVEWQGALCDSGQQFADDKSLPIHFCHYNVLEPLPSSLLADKDAAVALHACGDLHIKLLRETVQNDIANVTISPCCYHLTQHQHYQPLSMAAQKLPLTLSKSALHMSVQETATAGQGVRNKRTLEVSYRLGFDALQQFLSHNTQYVSVPSCAKSVISQGFEYFCQWASNKKGIELAEGLDYDHWLAVGRKRMQMTERLELLKDVFRRPVEIWLLLDRALYLEEHGYKTHIGTFCEPQLTPRNLMLMASRTA